MKDVAAIEALNDKLERLIQAVAMLSPPSPPASAARQAANVAGGASSDEAAADPGTGDGGTAGSRVAARMSGMRAPSGCAGSDASTFAATGYRSFTGIGKDRPE